MSVTDSSLLGIGGTPIKAALLHLCAMRDANSSRNGLVGASLKATSFLLSAMRFTNSSLLDLVGTPLKPAALMFCTMCDTNSSLLGLIGTSLAKLHRGFFFIIVGLTPGWDLLATVFSFCLCILFLLWELATEIEASLVPLQLSTSWLLWLPPPLDDDDTNETNTDDE
jgi:hypothetical protein